MPAKHLLRTYEEGAYLHIYNSGVEKLQIFKDLQDYEFFMNFLKDYLSDPTTNESRKTSFTVKGKTFQGTPHQPKNYFNKVELVAYSLEPSRFDLLIHQLTGGASERFIRSLCTRYSMYFNKKYNRNGSLFAGPYRSEEISGKEGLINASINIHKLGIQNANSSYLEFLKQRVTTWVKPDVILNSLDSGINYSELIKTPNVKTKTSNLTSQKVAVPLTPKYQLTQSPARSSRIFEYTFVVVVFVILLGIGIAHININTISNAVNSSRVLSAATASHEVVVKINDGSKSVYIYKDSSAFSVIVGQAKQGETFPLLAQNEDWNEIKLPNSQVGYISTKYSYIK